MSNYPIEKQFARLGLSPNDQRAHLVVGVGPDTVSTQALTINPKPTYKAQPQAPVIPRSLNAPSYLEPSFSTLLRAEGPFPTPTSDLSNYENVAPFVYADEPIYHNVQPRSSLSPYLPPPPPPPLLPCANETDLPLPSPPSPSDDLTGYYPGDQLHVFPPPPSADEITSPPSPVSSSYSELRRAVCGSTSGSNYAPLSQVSGSLSSPRPFLRVYQNGLASHYDQGSAPLALHRAGHTLIDRQDN